MASGDQKEKSDEDDNIESVEVDGEKDEKPEKTESAEEKQHHANSELGDSDEVMSDREPPKPAGKIKRFFHAYWHKKLWTIPLTILVFVGIIFAIPSTRYKVLGLWVTNGVAVTVTDSTTGTPITGANVTMDGKNAVTDAKGHAFLTVSVGDQTLKITKQYYKDFSGQIFVSTGEKQIKDEKLVATGRQVPVTVLDKISGKPLTGATIKVVDTSATTDSSGKAVIVLPTGSESLTATITASGYIDLSSKVQVTENVVAANTFKLTPNGKVYFLSDQSGNIDVVSTNLDGTDRKTVLAGTGNEDQGNTVLLASRDWKYLALLSKRDNGKFAKIYLIDTSNNNQLTTMDEGKAGFSPVGWSDHNFIYQVNRENVQAWQAGQSALKSYDADTKKVTTIDQTYATGSSDSYIGTSLAFVNIIKDKVIYGMAWSANNGYSGRYIGGQKNKIISVNADGSNKVDLHDIPIPKYGDPRDVTDLNSNTYLSTVLKDPETLYIQSSISSFSRTVQAYFIYKYDNNSVSQSNLVSADIYNKAQQNQITYLASPSNKQALWYQERDGKNNIFVGDYDGSNGKQIAAGTDYISYGWYTDNYILLEKNGSELYVMAPQEGAKAMKISNYYKPPRSFYGYGGGYGGL
ncbi:MAG TPA: carboxypeptidase regulatory-like domain-containing protein [Candidatus Saccharimonadales bacterium]|nr:carboxypeptidase regulatory-like domain-containing protein [Candidatus Saccharimonadales bacterium]